MVDVATNVWAEIPVLELQPYVYILGVIACFPKFLRGRITHYYQDRQHLSSHCAYQLILESPVPDQNLEFTYCNDAGSGKARRGVTCASL
jgi:hypothetical protein